MPSFAAITLVAPGVRFKAFDIFFTPDFAFANVFIFRTSSFVQARRIIFFAFANLFSECFYCGVGLYHGEICSQPWKLLFNETPLRARRMEVKNQPLIATYSCQSGSFPIVSNICRGMRA